ncbi:MAG: GNAT family N-acetyltransferase [Saprospiraceae bacterium]|nr:GNAT family N-acetyltransferase [Saprospiraceae bacterium]
MNERPVLRLTERGDVREILRIYAPYILEHWTSFEERVPDEAGMWSRIALGDYPWLSAVTPAGLAGYAYAGPHRQRAAYRWSCEVSVYVDHPWLRRGLASRLYGCLFALLQAQGLHLALAGVVVPNPPSMAFHQALGFEVVGTYRNIGYKQGAWRDVCWLQKQLIPAVGEPGPLRPFHDLDAKLIRDILEEGNKKG